MRWSFRRLDINRLSNKISFSYYDLSSQNPDKVRRAQVIMYLDKTSPISQFLANTKSKIFLRQRIRC
jgi:hypothetical protein